MIATALLSAEYGDLLVPTAITRRALRADDVDVRVTYCGVCHSDLHALDTPPERGGAYPLVPGHEFVGEVIAVGGDVEHFRVGDSVAVGNIVDSCGICRMCLAGQENFCEEFPTLTYGGRDRVDGSLTLGAYSDRYVVSERFVYRRPENLDPAAVAPLLCAGITVWEPLRSAQVGPGTRLGIVGIGGLGHLAIKLGVALGADVTVFTHSPGKVDDALALGATRVVVSTDAEAMAARRSTLDVVIDTVSVDHDLSPYLGVLDLDGILFSVGYLGPVTIATIDLLVGRKRLASAGSGGRPSTQELLDFCSEHGVVADVEIVTPDRMAETLDRLRSNDVRYRFVLDLATLATTP
jgi:uncharacterized zinc-type alcohol dehydrogenase-like protein